MVHLVIWSFTASSSSSWRVMNRTGAYDKLYAFSFMCQLVILSIVSLKILGVCSRAEDRKIIVADFLPLNSMKDQATGQWCFTWDQDSLLLQLKDGFSSDVEVIYVGCLDADIDISEQEEVSQKLMEEYKCMPTFLPPELFQMYYHGFCKQQLWPLFHYMLPICLHKGDLFDRSLFQAYISANKKFAEKVMEVINSDDDYVWIHDYYLMLLPTFLRKRLNQVKIGFFLHSPFPSSEIYRTLPVREEILKSLLNADLIGFQTYDYARHFLSCCSRMLGLHYESKRGYIGLEYYGRTVSIKILSVGIHIGRLQSVLNHPATASKVQEIEKNFQGKKLLLGVDDMDLFKGISLKLLAFELLLERHPTLREKIILVQIVNPTRSMGKDVKEAIEDTLLITERINNSYGTPGYEPVVLIDKPIPFHEKIAFYVAAECCIVNAVRDGMNLVPYEYVVCRQGTEEMDKSRGFHVGSTHTSTLIVSEFVGCSPSLSGAFRVNPWSIEDVSDALYRSINSGETERQMQHEKHYRYVSTHDVAHWARSFSQDLKRACKDHYSWRCWALGFGLNFRRERGITCSCKKGRKRRWKKGICPQGNKQQRMERIALSVNPTPHHTHHLETCEQPLTQLRHDAQGNESVGNAHSCTDLAGWVQLCFSLFICKWVFCSFLAFLCCITSSFSCCFGLVEIVGVAVSNAASNAASSLLKRLWSLKSTTKTGILHSTLASLVSLSMLLT
ncbi:hypothetical protein C4D60_Mb08t23900 [Musa balbisiana]|uniref:Uncharacterized protein n=1 Tax=Musa balbisiana TaxID=52838 RepID=A0A4S8K623_MUSBA|nr:hypothetical protein C4D60_Mb08t23900 [Musa balbisiana]